ncbi:MAG: MarR family transcriptional regulator [Firmicutes bacterium HGW-Firmicutes-7]|nr:MAG: MarR family transcriptional regulator [Firmicutes bacterium HGW-Firmicutes-7]
MNEMQNSLNHLLVKLFNNILKIEEHVLINEEYKDISITDMHVIEAISYDSSRNMSSVAKDLGITMGTLTIAINNLVKKEYVKRTRSIKDRRVVLICLTAKGQRAYKHHELFHENMIIEIKKQIDEEEEIVLLKTLNSLNEYFKTVTPGSKK